MQSEEWEDKYRRCEERQLTYPIHVAVFAFKNFMECNYYKNIEKLAERLFEAQQEVLKLFQRSDYATLVLKSNNLQIDYTGETYPAISFAFLTSPNQYDIRTMVDSKYKQCLSGYRLYWEEQIANLTRKNAIINRRKYLIDQLDEMDDYMSGIGTDKYHDIIIDYRNFNISEIDKLNSH